MNFKILQLAHGKIIPEYTSGYSMRCYNILTNTNRKIVSVGGLIFKDIKNEEIEQYRSIMLMIQSYLKGNRYFEIGISKSHLVRQKFKKRIKKLVNDYDIIVFEGPWLFPLLENELIGKFVIYDAHNVEFNLRKENVYQEETKDIEGSLVKRADIIFALSKEDKQSIIDIYNKNENKVIYLPQTKKPQEYAWKGYQSHDFVFIGSMYIPNIEALRVVENLAAKFPEFKFHIIGDFSKVRKKKLKNMIYHGEMNEAQKRPIFNNVLAGLNPVLTGGGRNLKMLDYFSYGLPVITTATGFRGLDLEEWKDIVFIDEVANFPEKIKYISENRDILRDLSKRVYDNYQKLYKRESSINAYEIIKEHINH